MIETSLVYVHAVKPARRFVGCGAVVEGGFVATCRHVWREATSAAAKADPASPPEVEVEFPHAREDNATVRRPTGLRDPCAPAANEPEADVVLLLPDRVPTGAMALQLAAHDRFETGKGYVIAGLVRHPNQPNLVAVDRLEGTIADFLRPDGRRQLTGANPAGYWSERGSSGSPVFRDGGQQLAGLLSLSELGANAGKSSLREAFVVPATTIRRHVVALVAGPEAARAGIDPAELEPVLEAIGARDVPVAEVAGRLRQFVEAARERAGTPVEPSNNGADIDAVIGAARDKLRGLDPTGARELLQAKIAEEERARRQRLLPLLWERAAIERLAFDHEAARTTLTEITQLAPDEVWAWIGLGDLWRTVGRLDPALRAYTEASQAARRTGEERDLAVSHNRAGDVRVAQGDLAGALAAYAAAQAIAEALAARDPANAQWQRDLSVSHERTGDVKVAQGDLAGALDAYAAAQAICEALPARDPANSEWQRDLSVSHNKAGDVKRAQGDLAGALDAYAAAQAICEALAARDPANAEWQR
ncbi:MAG: hypothetical protein JOY65_16600, partial [Acetobacteraceae bacterium]|nr:hypothetical protein [Acetobacteraceae bacterium]